MAVFQAAKDGIDSVAVMFDRKPAHYKAGEDLTGKVLVACSANTLIKGVKINIYGQMTVYWKVVEGGNTTEFAEFEDYLDETITVWIPNPKVREDQWLREGNHEYDFSWTLPIDIPQTLEDSRYGTLNYVVKGTVVLTQGRSSTSMEETFFLRAIPDPMFPRLAEEDLPKENCVYESLGGGICSKKTDIELYMSLERNTYKLGDKIPVHVECATKGGSAYIDKVIVLVVQEAIYICNMGGKEEVRKKERLVYDDKEDKEDSKRGETKSYDFVLELDKTLPLTYFPWCEFIQMEYFVHAVARTQSTYDDIVVKLPIVIEPKEDGDEVPEADPEEVVIENPEEMENNDADPEIGAAVITDDPVDETNPEPTEGDEEIPETTNNDDNDEKDEQKEEDKPDDEKTDEELVEEEMETLTTEE